MRVKKCFHLLPNKQFSGLRETTINTFLIIGQNRGSKERDNPAPSSSQPSFQESISSLVINIIRVKSIPDRTDAHWRKGKERREEEGSRVEKKTSPPPLQSLSVNHSLKTTMLLLLLHS